jgi:hypothetical protein
MNWAQRPSCGETAGAARHCGRVGTNAFGATCCGRPDAPSPHGISDGYNGLNPPPVGAVSVLPRGTVCQQPD